jgi:hypothetical protein
VAVGIIAGCFYACMRVCLKKKPKIQDAKEVPKVAYEGETKTKFHFYFDKDSILINKFLSGDKYALYTARSSTGKLAIEEFHWIAYMKWIIILNFILYNAVCLIYPFINRP